MSSPITIDQSVLSCLAAVAEVAVYDLTSGLEDGSYEDDEINGWSSEAIQAAINDAEEALHSA
jgi:hypothetical protein